MTLSRAYECAPNIKLVGGMTRAQRARAYRQMERIRNAYERSAKSMLRSTFDAERQAVEALEDPDERSILQAVKSTQKQKERILSWLYTSVAEEVYPMVDEDMTAKAWRDRLERKASGMPEEDDVWLVAIRRWILEQCGTKIVQIDETTLEEIRRIYYSAESVIDFRIKLDSLYLDQIIPNRSSVIARTESTAASNRASLETAKSLDSARTEFKMWNTALDAEVRDTHKHLESRSVELSESFRWTGRFGQVQMDCPADSTHGAPAGEVVNCRCFITFHT